MFEVEGDYAQARVFAKELEKGTITQIRTLCSQPFAEGAQIRKASEGGGRKRRRKH